MVGRPNYHRMDGDKEDLGEDLPLKQRAFVHIIASGVRNRTDAAEMAGYGGDRKTLGVRATKLWADPKVEAYWKSLCPSPPSETTRQECLDKMWEIVRTTKNDMARLRSLETIGRWHGFDTQRVRVDIYSHRTVDDLSDELRDVKQRAYEERGSGFLEQELLAILQVVGTRSVIEDALQLLPLSDNGQVLEHVA